MRGTVKWFNDESGYGFISIAEGEKAGKDAFAHRTDLTQECAGPDGGRRSLREGQEVEFDLTIGPKGPKAQNVRPAGNANL